MTTIAIVTIHSSTVMKLGTGLELSLNHYKNGIIYINVPAEETSANVIRFFEIVKQQIESYPGLKAQKLSLSLNSTEIEDGKLSMLLLSVFFFELNQFYDSDTFYVI